MNTHKIITGKAINKTAAIVTGQGVHFNPKMPKTDYATFDAMPPIRKPNAIEKRQRCFKNLAGMRVGRFVVIGLSSDVSRRWVVRCDCGKYEMRTAKFLKSPPLDLNNTRCQHCIQNNKVINSYRRYEKWLSFGDQKRKNREESL